MKWIILFAVLTVLISQTYCFPTKADSTANKGKTTDVAKKSTPSDDNDYDGLLKVLLASKLGNLKGNDADDDDDDNDDDDMSNFISNLQQIINKNDNSDDDDDDDDMSTMLGILATQNKDMFDSDKTIKEQYVRAILRGGYKIYKYCRKHPRNYYCRKGKHYGRKAYKKMMRWFG